MAKTSKMPMEAVAHAALELATRYKAMLGKPKEQRLNSLAGLCGGLSYITEPGNTFQYPSTISSGANLVEANLVQMFTLNRPALNYAYKSQWLVQNLIDIPVDDAFRGGIDIECPEVDAEEIKSLLYDLNDPHPFPNSTLVGSQKWVVWQSANELSSSDIDVCKKICKWARLFGGAGLIINTTQNFAEDFDPTTLTKDMPLNFIDADRWELILSTVNIWSDGCTTPYNYYGYPLNRSRVVKMLGIDAPSLLRPRLQGWGLSEVERCLRPIDAFLKFENTVFELMDEAKLDVYGIGQLNESLLTTEGTGLVRERLLLSNQLKNTQNALVMDKEDVFEQKQISFSGIAEMWHEHRLNLSSAIRHPMNKLFGESAEGFGSGQDALENYNNVVENIRDRCTAIVKTVVSLRMQQKWGYIPEFAIRWKSLKVMDGVQEEQVNTSKQNRILALGDRGWINAKEGSTMLRKEGLLSMDTEVYNGDRDVALPGELGPDGMPMPTAGGAGKQPSSGRDRLSPDQRKAISSKGGQARARTQIKAEAA